MNHARVSRRALLKSAVAGVVAAPLLVRTVLAAEQPVKEVFTLPALPWPRDALAPLISKETIDFHYGKHHAAYVTNLNKLIAGTPFETITLEEIIGKAPAGPLFNNAAQVWNHSFYWQCLAPQAGGQPEGKLAEAIEKAFGSFAKFQAKFTDTAVKLFGSGWTWLVQNKDGGLAIEGFGNAGTPVKEGKTPLLTCDVWEHAYYIDYRNARPKYVEAFWKLVNWKTAAERLA